MGKGGLTFAWRQYGETLLARPVGGIRGPDFFGTGISVLENGNELLIGAPESLGSDGNPQSRGTGQLNFFTKGSWVFEKTASAQTGDDEIGVSVKLFNKSKFKLYGAPGYVPRGD